MKIGFVGQGYVGKNYADYFHEEGHEVVRYSLEPEFAKNKDQIADCGIVLIAVPTPTTPNGFDDSNVDAALDLVGDGKIAVIKSTLLPGTTVKLQKKYPKKYIFHAPEFLSKDSAKEDTRNPRRKIIGTPSSDPLYIEKAQLVLTLLPKAPYTLICDAATAELLKYANNTFFYTKIVFMNMLYDSVEKHGGNWDAFKEAMSNEPWIGKMHIEPIHKTGRGAGGDCFVKDFAAFKQQYQKIMNDQIGSDLLELIEQKNLSLLNQTNKDTAIRISVYGV